MNLVLLGPPGAGKGTQAVMLSEKLGFLHLSAGDILRDNVKNSTDIGKKAKAFMDKGELVPDDIVIKMMLDKINALGNTEKFMLDGFPRTVYQADKLDEALNKLGLSIQLVIYLKTSTKTVVLRLAGRRLCKNCGANYHIVNMPPKEQGICDKCGGELYQRKDDSEATIKNRLQVYETQTKELIDYYKKKKVLKELSGDLDAGEVYKEIFEILNDRNKDGKRNCSCAKSR